MSGVGRHIGNSRLRWCGWLAAGCLGCGSLLAQTVGLMHGELPTPVSGDGASGDNFGISIAVDEDTVVVGAYGDTVVVPGATFGISQGSAYVFERLGSSWVQRQKLTPQPIGENGDNFAVAMAMDEGFVAVGAPRRAVGAAAEAGSVFVYGPSSEGFLLRQLITPGSIAAEQRFGTALALSQERLAVAAPGAGAGRVDLYRRDHSGQFQFEQSLLPPGGAEGDRFGAALAISADVLLIGAPEADGGGAVYSSNWDGNAWSQAARLPLIAPAGAKLGAAIAAEAGLALVGAPGADAGEVRLLGITGAPTQLGVLVRAGAAPGDRFGSAVSLNGTRALVSAGAALLGEGAVSVYSRSANALTLMTELDIADGGTSNHFGTALGLTADGVYIGADLDRVGPNRAQGSVRWYSVAAGSITAVGQLDAGDGAMFDRYGTSVAIDGDTALIGAYLEDTAAGADAGAAHWFQRSGSQWVYGGRLDAPDAAVEDRFGIAVAMDGNYAVIGAMWDVVGTHVDQGSAYVYRRESGNWVFDAKLTASDGRERDLFGFAVAIQGDRVLVGARGAAVPFVDQGRAYVYLRGTGGWTEEAQLNLPEAGSFTYFGASVALTPDRAIVGAPGFSNAQGPVSAGAAFVYARSAGGWTPLTVFQAPVPRANAAFGFSVAADAERFLVGAFQDGDGVRGAAYVYRSSDLGLDAELTAAVPQTGEGLGISVAIAGDLAILGGSGFDVNGEVNQGTARLFRRTAAGWSESTQWFAANGVAGDGFGRAVAIDASALIVGAPARGVANPLEGTAYVQLLDLVFGDGFE